MWRQSEVALLKTNLPTVGLMNPMGFFPRASLASLTADKIEAVTGVEADVPKTSSNDPLMATT